MKSVKWALVLIFFFSFPFNTFPQSDPSPVNVLLLYSYDIEAKGIISFDEGLRKAFAGDSSVSAQFFTEYMDTSRFHGDEYTSQLFEYYKTKYRNIPIDIIITYASPSLDFLLDYGEELFPEVPVVFGLVSETIVKKRSFSANYTGILSGPQFDSTLAAALKMLPGTKMVVVAGGIHTVDAQYISVAKNQLQPFRARVRIEYVNQLGMDELLDFVGELPAHTVVIYSLMRTDAKGVDYGPKDAATLIAENANSPVFGISETHLGTGLVGGFLNSTSLVGRKSARAAIDILNGKKQTEFTTYSEETSAYYFDWRELRRWGIDEKRLPPDSEILFREYTVWEQYSKQIIALIMLISLETILIGTLLLNRRQRIRVQKNLQESERLWKTVLEILPVGVWITDREGAVIHENPAEQKLWSGTADAGQITPAERRAWRLDTGEPIDSAEWSVVKAIKAGEATLEDELEIECSDGTRRFILNWAVPILGADNTIEGAVGVNSDITAREQAKDQISQSLREKETLLRELYHRTKNNMQVISSMLTLQSSRTTSKKVKLIIDDIENKIQTMALVHQKLYQSKDLSRINLKEYLEELSELLLNSYCCKPQEISLAIEMEPVSALIDTAIPCGLILNELMSNTFKYAFPESGKGIIDIRLFRNSRGEIELLFSDNGVGVPEDFDFRTQDSLGLQTIFALGEQQLNGAVEFKNGNGLHCRITFADGIYSPRV